MVVGYGVSISVRDDVWIKENSPSEIFPENDFISQNKQIKVTDL